jgi:hypothetical protein
MNRHIAACLIVVAIVVAAVSAFQARPIFPALLAADSQAQPPSQTPAVTRIDGRLHPESVPPEIAWEHFFQAMVMAGFDKRDDAEPRAEIVEALSKYNLFIPQTQVRTVLRVSKATIAKIEALRRPLDPQGQGKGQPGLTRAKRDALLKDVGTTVLSGRDELVEQLPRKDMAALDRYLVTTIIPSIKTQVVKD